jgi:6-phosphogluconate dehydrogenase
MAPKADIALIGLAVMGQNLVLNMNDKGYRVAVFNRSIEKVDEFLAGPARGREGIRGAHSLQEAVSMLASPRRVMLMVKAGEAVDQTIERLIPLLEKDDIIIDGGNSHFTDTARRVGHCAGKGILYVGAGVSGGEEGARRGPSIMPGGNEAAWPVLRELFQAICAKTDRGEPCCDWVGGGGAGHFVKMVHNGIEYGDMQCIGEAYHLMKAGLCMTAGDMQRQFAEWNRGDLSSYLVEITADILGYTNGDGLPLVEKILDVSGQKGTGKWTSATSLDLGVPVTLIAEAVNSRSLSALKEERTEAARVLAGPDDVFTGKKSAFIEDIRCALLASKIVSYAQGFMLMREAAATYGWKLNYGNIALLWRNGCIIRSAFLDRIKSAFDARPGLPCLLLDPYFSQVIEKGQKSWRSAIVRGVELGIPLPAFSSALAFYDGYRTARLPANLLQAQRDYFGAHTYERTDRPRGEFFHTNWTGKGGTQASSAYNA